MHALNHAETTARTLIVYPNLYSALGMERDRSSSVGNRMMDAAFMKFYRLACPSIDCIGSPSSPGFKPRTRELPGGSLCGERGISWGMASYYCGIMANPIKDVSLGDPAKIRRPDPTAEGRFKGSRERATAPHDETGLAVVLAHKTHADICPERIHAVYETAAAEWAHS